MAGPPKPLNLGSKPSAPSYGEPAVPATYAAPPQAGGMIQVGSLVPSTPVAVNNSLQPTSPGQTPSAPITLEQVNQVGKRSQQRVEQISRQLVGSVKTSDMGPIGDMMGQTLIAAKGLDPSNAKPKLFGLIKRKVEEIRIGYEKAESTLDRLIGQMDGRLAKHRQRDADIKQMIEENERCYHELGTEIQQLEAKLDWMEANVPVPDPSNPMSAQRVQDWNLVCAMGRKHAQDLERTRAICLGMDAQLRTYKQNGLMMVQKFDSFKTTTIPILRAGFVIHVIGEEQAHSARMASMVDDLTDTTLKENARKLGQTTAAVYASATRSNIGVDAIRANYDAIIQSAEAADQAIKEMKSRLATEAPQIEDMQRELTARLASSGA